MNANGLLEAALAYAELGYAIFPIIPGGKAPLTANGFKDAATDCGQIKRWWREHRNANIGMATEGLVVIDEDRPDNPWLKDAPERQTDLAGAPMSITPRSGNHRIMRQPHGKSWRCSTGKIAPKVDVRADGGYIVLPPSVRREGIYRWQETMELDCPPAELPEPPGWLVDLLDEVATRGDTARTVASGATGANRIPSGLRNATLASLGGTMRRVGMSEAEILAALVTANDERCEPPLSRTEVEQIASSVSRYEPDAVATALAENHFEQQFGEQTKDTPTSLPDPGPMPDELLRVPGFVSEVMDHCLDTVPYPNVAMAFCGALSLQSFLTGRKVRDPGDNRTNIYLLGLAHSGVGKDWPRKINTRILHRIGLADCLGERFASGEGIQDALFGKPCMLFQTDEIDGILQSINKAKDARHENIMSTLLTMYSSANSVFPMRRKAGKESPGVIDQPCLTIFGTAIPNHYYEALSERMLTNGFFARMLILEAGKRSAGQEPSIRELPSRVLATAKWWADFEPGTGNLKNWHPEPAVVEHSDEARRLLSEARTQAEIEYGRAEGCNDPVGTTVWGRVSEQTRKLALLYAVSENHESPLISLAAAQWATRFVMHQTRRMLYMAQSHVADNPFHALCLKLMQKLRDAPHMTLPHSVLMKRMKIDAKSFRDLINTLVQQGDVTATHVLTPGRTGVVYRLSEGERSGEAGL